MMLFPSRMRKLEILLLKDNKDEVLQDLYGLECIEMLECKMCEKYPVPSATRDCVSKAIQIDRILNFIGHYAPKAKPSLMESIRGIQLPKKQVGLVPAESLLEQCDNILDVLDPNVKAIERKLGDLAEEQDVLEEYIRFLDDVSGLDMDLALLKSTSKTLKVVGKTDVLDREAFDKALSDSTEGSYTLSFWKDLAFITTFKEKERSIDLLFSTFSIKRVAVPLLEGTPEQLRPQLEEKQKKLESEKAGLVESIVEINTEWELKLRALKELLEIEAEKSNAFRHMASTDNVIAVEAFVPKDREKEISELLMGHSYLSMKFKEPEGEPSILLKNKGFFRPFEILTELYGLPKYNEIDPTTFFAIFFTMFFGIMMTDFVYGIFIAVIGMFLVKNIKEGTMHDFSLVLLYGGIATAVCGIAFGSYFGDFVNGENYLNLGLPMIIDPLYGAMEILIFSLAVGLLHLGLSNIVGLYQRVHNGVFREAIIENVSWLLLIIGVIDASLGLFAGVSQNVIIAIAGGPIAFAVAILFVDGIRNGLAGMITAFMSIPSFMGNWLSYARLLALALSTAGIGMVVNLFAQMAWGLNVVGIPIGIIFAVIMFVGGHLFNLGINGLGAFVHSLRLHYVEFFSYFYNADGKKFEPLKIVRTYTKYINEKG